ncbi:TetR/AcrR family transcriptional regulator [Gemmatimonas sp.]|uniref:TetR/AcrR family transcriptional regulator n=1 Tax=Gemmatimonas sp. TaxID=1962908 RepID=UPI00398365D8
MNKLHDGVPIQILVDEKLFLKDPNSSDVGLRIIEHGIQLMDEIGFESFTFRKLADRIGTTEPTIYRYFRGKHRLLLYLTSWYWSWMEYRVHVATSNVTAPDDRLRNALEALTQPIHADDVTPHIDEAALYRIVVAESSKVYLNKLVAAENREGLFRSYKRLCRRVAEMISAVNPVYAYPVALVSTVVESSHVQKYFAEHLPSLTEVTHLDADHSTTVFLTEMVFRTIGAT